MRKDRALLEKGRARLVLILESTEVAAAGLIEVLRSQCQRQSTVATEIRDLRQQVSGVTSTRWSIVLFVIGEQMIGGFGRLRETHL